MNARRGLTNHLLVESFERLHKSLLHMGYTDHESTRGAAALTFALSGEYTREQAWEAADEIAAQRNNRGASTKTSEILLPDGAEYTESGTRAPLLP